MSTDQIAKRREYNRKYYHNVVKVKRDRMKEELEFLREKLNSQEDIDSLNERIIRLTEENIAKNLELKELRNNFTVEYKDVIISSNERELLEEEISLLKDEVEIKNTDLRELAIFQEEAETLRDELELAREELEGSNAKIERMIDDFNYMREAYNELKEKNFLLHEKLEKLSLIK